MELDYYANGISRSTRCARGIRADRRSQRLDHSVPDHHPVIAAGHCRHGALYGVWHWNKWFDALIYLRDRDLFPLQLILREILIQNDTSKDDDLGRRGDRMPVGETIKYATIMVATPPILFLYPFLQKYFVKGVMIGAIKE